MANVAVQKVEKADIKALPIFEAAVHQVLGEVPPDICHYRKSCRPQPRLPLWSSSPRFGALITENSGGGAIVR